MFIVGIDIAKRSHEAIIIAEDGQVVRKAFSFRNNCTGYNLLLEQVRRLTLVKSQIVFAMESTALATLKTPSILLYHGKLKAKNMAETAQSRFSSRFFLFSACI